MRADLTVLKVDHAHYKPVPTSVLPVKRKDNFQFSRETSDIFVRQTKLQAEALSQSLLQF